MVLAAYACDPAASRGRLFDEGMATFRSPYQRDRDRIIHSSAFRRLKHKTQVFVADEGDHYRTRLTHSIEVAQVARTLAGALGLNVDLAETIALAHDLGHTPFGHVGEDVLAGLMAPYGGFDHNAQTLRIVTLLERHYASFDGLNLTWEALEGIAKHNGPALASGADFGALPYALRVANQAWDLELTSYASAEAQVAAIADDIAYTHHDLQDGLRSGLFQDADLRDLPVTGAAFAEVDRLYPNLAPARRRHEALRRVFGVMVEDVRACAQARLADLRPRSVADVRGARAAVVAFTPDLFAQLKQVRGFLFEKMYRAPPVMAMRAEVTQLLEELFPCYLAAPSEMPAEWQAEIGRLEGAGLCAQDAVARSVADYVAGMTDRFATQEHHRLTGRRLTGVSLRP